MFDTNFWNTPRRVRDDAVLRGPRIVRDAETNDLTTVVERGCEGTAGAPRTTCLVFHTERGFTRVWQFPDDWQTLSDEDLLALQLRARGSRSA